MPLIEVNLTALRVASQRKKEEDNPAADEELADLTQDGTTRQSVATRSLPSKWSVAGTGTFPHSFPRIVRRTRLQRKTSITFCSLQLQAGAGNYFFTVHQLQNFFDISIRRLQGSGQGACDGHILH